MGATGTRRTSEGLLIGLVALFLMVMAVACGGGDESSFDTVGASISGASSGGDDDHAVEAGGSPEASAAEGADDDTSADDEGSEPVRALGADALVNSGREFVSTAALTVETEDVGAAEDEAVTIVEAVGGALFGESSEYRDTAVATLTFKVPPTSFSQTLDDLGDLGSIVTQSVETDDVTEQVVDLDSRIATAAESVDRLRGFLAGATTVEAVSGWEDELMQRENELESLRAQRRTIEGQVSFATIELTLTSAEPEADESDDEPIVAAAAVEPEPDESLPGFVDGLRGSWEAFLDVGTVALAVVGVILPWLPLVLAAWLASRLWRRWARRATPVPAE